MLKAKFTENGLEGMTIEYDDPMSGLRTCRTFSLRGSYVYELLSADKSIQMFEGLSSSGIPLLARNRNFHEVIRYEYRKMRKQLIREVS